MEALLPCCCGVDVHDKMIETCIIKGLTNKPEKIRTQFSTLPNDLKKFATHLYNNDCYHIAMESTGVYWHPIYEAIENYSQYYENIVVANASHIKNVPGRKSDVKDAEWIATLLRHGLITSSFVPNRTIRNLRETARAYKKFVGEKCRYVSRIEKLLQTHGFKISLVLTDILCVTGRNILNSLALRGSLTIQDVESCIRGKTKHTAIEIHSAISGCLNEFERKTLAIILNKIETAESDIQNIVSLMSEIAQPYQKQLDQIDSIPGIDVIASLLIMAEIGCSPKENFQTSEKLCSWAGLVPRNDVSAEKTICKNIMPGNKYLKSIMCQVAWVAVKQRGTPFHTWVWSHKRKLGEKVAITAVSRKILALIFKLISDDLYYDNSVALSNLNHKIKFLATPFKNAMACLLCFHLFSRLFGYSH